MRQATVACARSPESQSQQGHETHERCARPEKTHRGQSRSPRVEPRERLLVNAASVPPGVGDSGHSEQYPITRGDVSRLREISAARVVALASDFGRLGCSHRLRNESAVLGNCFVGLRT